MIHYNFINITFTQIKIQSDGDVKNSTLARAIGESS